MVRALIGYTGFVGSNLCQQADFQRKYNSKNIEEIRDTECDLLVCAGAPAAKWWANQHPDEDWQSIKRLIDNLTSVRCQKCVLISTIDVYRRPLDVDENTEIEIDGLHPYGLHRYRLECALRSAYGDALHIIRLPALFGPGLKKNVLYDLICNNMIESINLESRFQWYPVTRLWSDIQKVLAHGLKLVNFASMPIVTREIVTRFFPDLHVGRNPSPLAEYDMRSIHAKLFSNRDDGYMLDGEEVLKEIEIWLSSPGVTCA